MGAWIETLLSDANVRKAKSHPVWVRGLKLRLICLIAVSSLSHPVWVRGLKLIRRYVKTTTVMSHPVWVRGLKHR